MSDVTVNAPDDLVENSSEDRKLSHFSDYGLGELRTYMRRVFGEGKRFVGHDKSHFSTFVNWGKKQELIAACVCGEVPKDWTKPFSGAHHQSPAEAVGAEPQGPAWVNLGVPPPPQASQPTAPASPAPVADPMAMFRHALDQAKAEGWADGRARGLSEGIAEGRAEAETRLDRTGIEESLAQATTKLETLDKELTSERARAQDLARKLSNQPRSTTGVPSEATSAAGAPPDVTGQGSVLQVISGGRIGGIEIPKEDRFYILSKTRLDILDACLERGIATGSPKGALLVGPKGCGKSTLPEQWSFLRGRPFFKANAALLREAKEWFGSKTASNGSLYFIMSEFCTALETPDCTVLIDEINRAIAQALNSLLGILDSGRCYVEELGRPVHIAPSVLICASMNEGSEYTVHELDSALKDRFPVRLECSYLEEKDEIQVIKNKAGVDDAMAKKVVLLGNTIRSKYVDSSAIGGTLHETMSTRQLIEVAAFLKKLGQPSLDYTVTARFSRVGGRDSEQCAVQGIIQGIFG